MKKKIALLSAVFICFFAFASSVLAGPNAVNMTDSGSGGSGTPVNPYGFCEKAAPIMQIAGIFFFIAKIVIPLIIIILASIELGSAAVSGEEKTIKEKATVLLKRSLIGIAIFLLPTFVRLIYFGIFNADRSNVDGTVEADSTRCIDCLTSPFDCVVHDHLSILN